MYPIGLVVFLSLIGIGLSCNEPSACQVRPLTCGSTSTIESELKEMSESHQGIRETLETGQTALIEELGVIADRLQDIPTSTMEPTTVLPTTMEPTTGLPTHGCPGDGWRQVAFLNMRDPNQVCPCGLQLTGYPFRTCGRVSTGYFSCDSVTFPVCGLQYSEVCGKATAYQLGWSIAFFGYNERGQNIDGAYLDGLSFTRGSPREHIWSFTAGVYTNSTGYHSNDRPRCPCVGGDASPPFVANNYFCDSATTTDNWRDNAFRPNYALWDGIGSAASCYDEPNVPWFVKELSNPTSDDIEMRMCFTNLEYYSNIALQEVEIYVR